MPHALNSAWDWRFSRFAPSLMTITLNDGSRISGWCGGDSFIGSDPNDRDLYIEHVDDEGNWTLKTPGKGIYIAGGDVRTIEIIPPNGASL